MQIFRLWGYFRRICSLIIWWWTHVSDAVKSCRVKTQQQLSLCLFWIICPPKTTVLMFYLSVKLYFSKYVLAANWCLTGLSSLLLFPVFPATLFILDCADSESQTDRQVRSRWEPDYGKAWESQGMACCRLYTWLLQMAMEMAWPDASYCMMLARSLFWGLCPGHSPKIKALIEAGRKAVLWYLNKELGL